MLPCMRSKRWRALQALQARYSSVKASPSSPPVQAGTGPQSLASACGGRPYLWHSTTLVGPPHHQRLSLHERTSCRHCIACLSASAGSGLSQKAGRLAGGGGRRQPQKHDALNRVHVRGAGWIC